MTDWERDYRLRRTVWVATLSNGEVVYQDDGAPGKTPYSAWLRLRGSVLEENLDIVDLYIQFRGHVERPVPSGAAGYFFRHSVLGSLFDRTSFGFFIVGHLEGGVVHAQRWKVPELYFVESDVRPIDDHKLVGESLISNRRVVDACESK